MQVSPQAKKSAVYLGDTWRDRLILIPSPKGEIKGVISSCLWAKTYPLEESLDVYWQRWEIEQGYGELKQYQLANKSVLRSLKATVFIKRYGEYSRPILRNGRDSPNV